MKKPAQKKVRADSSKRQEVFCVEFLVDLNGTNAAIRAGYSEKTSYSMASRLLKNVKVRTRVAELMDERGSEIIIS